MPKTNIFSKTNNGCPDTTRPIVRVGWSKESSSVQIATVHKDYIVLEPSPEGNGWFMDLERNEINELIVALRKARDQVFGKDQ